MQNDEWKYFTKNFYLDLVQMTIDRKMLLKYNTNKKTI